MASPLRSLRLLRPRDIAFDEPLAASAAAANQGFSYNHTRLRRGTLLPQDGAGTRVVVKEVSTVRASRQAAAGEALNRLRHEARVYAQVGTHSSILRCFGTVEDQHASGSHSRNADFTFGLVAEECTGGTLDEALRQWILQKRGAAAALEAEAAADGENAVRLLRDIVSALAHLHGSGVMHRDIKPANVFLTTDGTARLADFDRAVDLNQCPGGMIQPAANDKPVGSLFHCAPEVLSGSGYGRPADIYSFGVLAWQVLHRAPLYPGNIGAGLPGTMSRAEFAAAVCRGLRPDSTHASAPSLTAPLAAQLVPLVRQCWHADPDQRPDMAELWKELDSLCSGELHFSSSQTQRRSQEFSLLGGASACTGTSSTIVGNAIGLAVSQGRRKAMEDVAFATMAAENTLVAGILDGHHGGDVAKAAGEFCRARLCRPFSSVAQVVSEAEEAISGLASAAEQGSTITVVGVSNEQVAVAWLGDSDAVLCRATKPPCEANDSSENLLGIPLTQAHLPSRESEKLRVQDAGGVLRRQTRMMDDGNEYPYGPARVYANGMGGGIAVTRALGDGQLRPAVSGEPETCPPFPVVPGADLFVMLASDGAWDVLQPGEACNVAWRSGFAGGLAGEKRLASWCPETAARGVLDEALHRGSQDNISVAIVALPTVTAPPTSDPGKDRQAAHAAREASRAPLIS